MLYVAYENRRFSIPIEYIFNLMLSTFEVEWKFLNYGELNTSEISEQTPLISYGKRKPGVSCTNHIHIYESYLFGQDYLKPESMPKIPISWFEDIPIIYKGEGKINEWIVSYRKDKVSYVETNIDILASSFFMITRYEEVVNPAEDEYQRFPANASLAYRQDFLGVPVVNAYIELLYIWLKRMVPGIRRKRFWNGMDFAICITHDVDKLKKFSLIPPLRRIFSGLINGKKAESLSLTRHYLEAKLRADPYYKFDYLMDLSEKYGFNSSYYFISGGKTEYENFYQMKNPQVIKLIKKISARGFEVGLHSSFNTFQDPVMLKEEKGILEKVLGEQVNGVRQHYLRWKTPQSWRVRVEAGFKYDTSLTFVSHEGFRCGICFPYRPFDILKNKVLDIWELPVTSMDYTFFGKQGLSPEQVLRRNIYLIDTVRKYRGVFVLLWHNTSLNEFSYQGGRGVYEAILRYLSKKRTFKGTVLDVVRRWSKNESERGPGDKKEE